MRSRSGPQSSAEAHVREIRRQTRKRHSTEEKIRIVLEGLRGELSIAELCRREGIAQSLYYTWSKEFLEAGLDDFSRYIVVWKLCSTIKADDVTDTLELALAAAGLAQADVNKRLRLLSDNGSSYVAGDLADWLEEQGMGHVRGAPYPPMTQGKIERWHQTLKNRILLEHYYLPGDLEAQIDDFVGHYNHCRYHESLGNLTPADVYSGRGPAILLQRERIKRETFKQRRLQHKQQAA